MATEATVREIKVNEQTQETGMRTFKDNAEVRAWLGLPSAIPPLPEWTWVPNEEWRRLEGILSDHPEHDTTEMKRRNRIEEEEHDARKFGRSSSE